MSIESINSNVAQQPAASAPNIERQAKTEQLAEVIKVDSLAKAGGSQGVDQVELKDAVAKLNDFVGSSKQSNLSFSIDKDTKEMVVTVRDVHTQEVIRQMPTEEALAVAKQIESMLGLILNLSLIHI